MTTALKRPCSHPGCSMLLLSREGSKCALHRRSNLAVERVTDQRRGSAAARGYGVEWQKARRQFLAQHPLCVGYRRNCRELATVVDHIKAHKGDQELFWDEANWQSLCKRCHDRKTSTEDRGAWTPTGT